MRPASNDIGPFGDSRFNQLHHQRALLHVVDLHNIAMVQSRKSLDFTLEACHALRVGRECFGQHLQRDIGSALVVGPIYLAQAACAERRKDLVWP